MNNIKRLFLGIAAIALTLTFSAFKETKAEKAPKFANAYYGWDQDDNRYEHLTAGLPNNSQCEVRGDKVCTIVIDTDSPQPTLTASEAQAAGADPYNNAGIGSYFNPTE